MTIPEGWKLVPIAPTVEMLRAAESGFDWAGSCGEARQPDLDDFRCCYEQMLEAAPEHCNLDAPRA
jgi:hypothetical protein